MEGNISTKSSKKKPGIFVCEKHKDSSPRKTLGNRKGKKNRDNRKKMKKVHKKTEKERSKS